ncbi:hypothetical protein BCL76_102473 [Streptomyces sp. CG 926]|uniref:hypothetical protein n=1 Tax=Streptomyces sp. CG 926 TaxID=1882405 RepID=UPI000D6B000F|nr:hypothetical protein [Streptomyces sp. CG 926]PWK73448.1 hypothetical protein BCL76_102473 [Streptomyces sp. CG 926]
MKPWRASPPALTPQEALDPYRFPGVWGLADEEEASFEGDAVTPDPRQGSAGRIGAAQRRRLDLLAALTTAGIPPLTADRHAVEAVAALDETTNAAVRRWIAGSR